MITMEAYAKINIGLDVTGQRDDGYHLVRMIMQSIDLCDTVTLEKSEKPGISLTIEAGEAGRDVSMIPVDDRNLCVKAAKAMLDAAGLSEEEGVRIHLVKRIPSEAGLGGGSADAAAVLHGMNVLFGLHETTEHLAKIGLPLGADIPFCVYGGTMLAEGIGEKLTPIDPPFCDATVLLVKPDFGESTGGVYTALDAICDPLHPDIDAMQEAIMEGDIHRLGKVMGNILEEVVFEKSPKLEKIKEDIIRCGSLGALMSGSGATVYGIFAGQQEAKKAEERIKEKYNGYFIKVCALQNAGVLRR